MSEAPAPAAAPAAAPAPAAEDPLVQHVVVRTDLQGALGWTAGSVIAQACHACVAVLFKNLANDSVAAYLADAEHMHKAVVQVPDEAALLALAGKLSAEGIGHHLWKEQPENIPTCLATIPVRKKLVHKSLRSLRLLK